MIEFKKLLVIPYNKGLYIECSVLDMPYFTNVYLDTITIDSQDTFDMKGISATPIYKYTVSGNTKQLKLSIPDTSLLVPSLDGTMFFVYVTVKGNPSIDVPCGLDSKTTLGVCVDSYSVYRKALHYLHETFETCEVPRMFIDFILRYKAFEISLKTRDFPLAILYWKKFRNNIVLPKSRCNG